MKIQQNMYGTSSPFENENLEFFQYSLIDETQVLSIGVSAASKVLPIKMIKQKKKMRQRDSFLLALSNLMNVLAYQHSFSSKFRYSSVLQY